MDLPRFGVEERIIIGGIDFGLDPTAGPIGGVIEDPDALGRAAQRIILLYTAPLLDRLFVRAGQPASFQQTADRLRRTALARVRLYVMDKGVKGAGDAGEPFAGHRSDDVGEQGHPFGVLYCKSRDTGHEAGAVEDGETLLCL